MMKSPFFMLIPESLRGLCPRCLGKGDDDPIVTIRPLIVGRSDRWIGVCPNCAVRFIVTMPAVATPASWTEPVTV